MNNIEIVDFYADWCGPCRMLSPILESLKEQLPEITITKVNVESEDGSILSSKLGIRNIPTIIFKKDGEIVGKKVGLGTLEDYIKIIKSFDE